MSHTAKQLTNEWCFDCKADTLHVKAVCNSCGKKKFRRIYPDRGRTGRRPDAMTVKKTRSQENGSQKHGNT